MNKTIMEPEDEIKALRAERDELLAASEITRLMAGDRVSRKAGARLASVLGAFRRGRVGACLLRAALKGGAK